MSSNSLSTTLGKRSRDQPLLLSVDSEGDTRTDVNTDLTASRKRLRKSGSESVNPATSMENEMELEADDGIDESQVSLTEDCPIHATNDAQYMEAVSSQAEEEEPISKSSQQGTFSVEMNERVESSDRIRSSATISNPSKGLAISNLRGRPCRRSSFDNLWSMLQESIVAIQNQQRHHATLEELFQIVECISAAAPSYKIYKKIGDCISVYVHSKCDQLLSNSGVSMTFLQRLGRIWENHCDQTIMIRSIFLHLDRTFVLQSGAILTIWDMSLKLFRSSVMENDTIQRRCMKEMISQIVDEREKVQIDRHLMKCILRMMLHLEMYHTVFEPKFFQSTKEFYVEESKKLVEELEVRDYLKYVQRRLDEETDRVSYYLDHSSQKHLLATVDACLIAEHMDSFVQKGFDEMVLEKNFDDLSLIYNLLSRTKDGLDILKQTFIKFIRKEGKKLVLTEDSDKTFVDDLLKFKRMLDSVVHRCFENSQRFIEAEKDAFDFVNIRVNKPAELVAKYMDSKLRAGNKFATEEELEALMDEVIVIFRFIEGKDVFESYFKRDLAKRLLLSRSASVDAEKSVLSKLKRECGADFTRKLEGMFKDMELSRDIAASFKQYLGNEDRKGSCKCDIEFSINILTSSFWPSYEQFSVNIPEPLKIPQEAFNQFYSLKYNGRKLRWQHDLSHLILRAYFGSQVIKELQVSMFQALILLLFNKETELPYKSIQSDTGLETNELSRTLLSLTCGKYRVLKKIPKSSEVNPTDIFSFNAAFNDRLYRIRICQIQMKETLGERVKIETSIQEDRQYQIDAAIVRTMKTRKTLAHSLLMSELYSQLRFPVKPVELKKRIESLIERDYMSRDDQDSTIYHYVS